MVKVRVVGACPRTPPAAARNVAAAARVNGRRRSTRLSDWQRVDERTVRCWHYTCHRITTKVGSPHAEKYPVCFMCRSPRLDKAIIDRDPALARQPPAERAARRLAG